jgi:hypothetical protein
LEHEPKFAARLADFMQRAPQRCPFHFSAYSGLLFFRVWRGRGTAVIEQSIQFFHEAGESVMVLLARNQVASLFHSLCRSSVDSTLDQIDECKKSVAKRSRGVNQGADSRAIDAGTKLGSPLAGRSETRSARFTTVKKTFPL